MRCTVILFWSIEASVGANISLSAAAAAAAVNKERNVLSEILKLQGWNRNIYSTRCHSYITTASNRSNTPNTNGPRNRRFRILYHPVAIFSVAAVSS